VWVEYGWLYWACVWICFLDRVKTSCCDFSSVCLGDVGDGVVSIAGVCAVCVGGLALLCGVVCGGVGGVGGIVVGVA